MGILGCTVNIAVLAQTPVFHFPLDTFPLLSGTFGEFRGSHFHAGIDIRTYGKVGLPVYAAADGYVSRIKISPFGYGKAIYLVHNDGYTSVYGHLSGFNTELEVYIRKHQYQKKSYSIELFPGKSHFRVKKGDLIAYSGNSGGSSAPHLHFELRDTKTQDILNPLNFSLGVRDTMAPVMVQVNGVERDRDFKIRNGHYPVAFELYTRNDSVFSAEVLEGDYALSLAAKDFLFGDTNNVLGVYQVEIFEDDSLLYHRSFSRFSFNDSRFIHLISSYSEGLPPIENCYKESWIYHSLANYRNDGWIRIDAQNRTRKIRICLTDEAGYTTTRYLNLSLSYLSDWTYSIGAVKAMPSDQNQMIFSDPITFSFEEQKHHIDFFKNSFFDSLEVHVSIKKGHCDTMVIYPSDVYVSERFRILYSLPADYSGSPEKACLARFDGTAVEYAGGDLTGNQLSCYTRNMGTYFLSSDTIAPEIKYIAHDAQKLEIEITDNFSGIQKYQARINNSWFLMEYDPKTGLLSGDLSEFGKGSKLELLLTVRDNKDNLQTLKQTLILP